MFEVVNAWDGRELRFGDLTQAFRSLQVEIQRVEPP